MNKIIITLFIIIIGTLPVQSYDFQSTERIPVYMTICEEIESEDSVYEGQQVNFRICQDVVFKNKIIVRRGTIVPARIETTIPPGMNGIPAIIILGNFNIPNIPKEKFIDEYEITGLDRSLWVFPLKWALTPLPPTGSFTNFIYGGHAKLKTSKIIKLYYYPNWS